SALAVEPVFVGAARRLRLAVDRRHEIPGAEAVDRRRGDAHLRAVPRHPGDSFTAFHRLFASNLNTYASLYNGVLQRDWFQSQAREYRSTLEAALHGNNIPTTVVENLIESTKAGTEPLRRYHRLRKRVLGLETYHNYDAVIPLVDLDEKYPYEDVLEWLPESVAPLGTEYQRLM